MVLKYLLRKNILTCLSYSGTSSFRGDVRNVTIQSKSNRLSYSLDIIESVQLLHYVSMLFPGPDGDAIQNNSGLLPCRNAEVVIQTRISPDGAEDGGVSQLVIQCRYLDIVITFILFTNT
jgi:hypothetical protein